MGLPELNLGPIEAFIGWYEKMIVFDLIMTSYASLTDMSRATFHLLANVKSINSSGMEYRFTLADESL